MIAMFVFTLVSTGIATSLFQLRKAGENSISQVLAQATAEGLLEQVRRINYTELSDFTTVPAPAVDLLFINVNASNRASVEPMTLDWATNDTDYTEIGARSDPADPASAKLGVLLDVDYQDSSGKLIRARRYMKMKINLTRSLNANKDAVQVCLRFQWAVPDRHTNSGDFIYYASREIRSVISKMPTY